MTTRKEQIEKAAIQIWPDADVDEWIMSQLVKMAEWADKNPKNPGQVEALKATKDRFNEIIQKQKEALEIATKALEETLPALVWLFKGPYGFSPDESILPETKNALNKIKEILGE